MVAKPPADALLLFVERHGRVKVPPCSQDQRLVVQAHLEVV